MMTPSNTFLSSLGLNWKNVLGAMVCFGVSAIGLVITSIECGRHGEGSVSRCLEYGSRNPYVILSLILLVIFGIAAIRKGGSGARNVLLWWVMLLFVFGAWWIVFA